MMNTKLMLALALALLSATPALAQQSAGAFDSRWSPYLGCWTIVQDQYGQSVPVPAGTMVCVQPSGRSGVAITTTVDGKTVLEQTVVADGSAQPISQGDCSGTQTSNWSRDGDRLFTSVDLDCANRPKRTVSGITLFANGQWIDAQATVIDGNSDVRLRRYRRASDQRAAAPAITTAPMTIEDVIEASAKVQSEALEAALDAVNTRIALNSRVLEQLADNGVSPNVIDLLVAQAYPDKFEVQRAYPSALSNYGSSSSYGSSSMGSSTIYMGSTMYPSPMYDPFYNSYYYYSPFAYPYYWGPSYSYRFGSPFYRNYYNYNNYYGFGGGGYYGGPSIPSGGNAQPGSPDAPSGNAIATGRGYTRVRPAGSSNSSGSGESATPSSRSSGSVRGVRSPSSSDSGATSSSPSSGSSSSGASSGGYSSGGGGGESGGGGGGRTAQPR